MEIPTQADLPNCKLRVNFTRMVSRVIFIKGNPFDRNRRLRKALPIVTTS